MAPPERLLQGVGRTQLHTFIRRPADISTFEFVILSGLRAVQLSRGCIPRIDAGHKPIVTAQLEVAQGKVVRLTQSSDTV